MMNEQSSLPESESVVLNDPQLPSAVPKRSHRKRVIIISAVVVIAFGALIASVYAREPTDAIVRRVSSILPLPALSVDGEWITIQEYLKEYDALKNYFASLDEASPMDSATIQETIVQTLTNKLAIRHLADAYDIILDEERVDAYYQEVVSSQESEEVFLQEVKDTFGWSADEFKTRILQSVVLTIQVSEYVMANEELQQERKAIADDAHARLIRGEDRSVIAKEVHEPFGLPGEGDFGYLNVSELSEEFVSAIALLTIGQFSEVIITDEGYTILTLVDRTEVGGQEQVHLMAIAVPKKNMEDVVKEYLETAKIKNYL